MRELNIVEPVFYITIFHLHMAYKVKQMSIMLNPCLYDVKVGVKGCILCGCGRCLKLELHFKRGHFPHINEIFPENRDKIPL